MKYKLLTALVLISCAVQAQQINPVPDYVFANRMSVGRNAVTDTLAYFSIGPRYGAIRGFMPPMVVDTALVTGGTKRNGLTIFSIQKNKYMYWDSVRVQWSDFAGSSGAYIFASDTSTMLNPYTRGSGTTNYVPKFTGTRTYGNSQIFDNGTNVGINIISPLARLHIADSSAGAIVTPLFVTNSAKNTALGQGAQIGFTNYSDASSNLSASIRSSITNIANGASHLQFYVNSGTAFNESMRITSGANVGINQTAPLGRFHVVGGASNNAQILVGYSNNSENYFDADTNIFRNGSFVESMRINSNRELLINTSSDAGAYALQVSGNIYSTGNATINNTNIGGTTPFITGSNVTAASGSGMAIGTVSSNNIFFYTNNTQAGFFNSAGELLITSGSTDAGAYALQVTGSIYNTTGAVFAASSGNVGIGVTSPDGGLEIRRPGTTDHLTFSRGVSVGNAGIKIGGNTLALVFENNSATELMRLTIGGELLIGTTTDAGAYALQVAGAIYNTTTLTTGAPTSGTAKPWRLGEAATVSPTSPNRTIRVEIDGTVYYIHAKTTND